jgi:hypothetical protein
MAGRHHGTAVGWDVAEGGNCVTIIKKLKSL